MAACWRRNRGIPAFCLCLLVADANLSGSTRSQTATANQRAVGDPLRRGPPSSAELGPRADPQLAVHPGENALNALRGQEGCLGHLPGGEAGGGSVAPSRSPRPARRRARQRAPVASAHTRSSAAARCSKTTRMASARSSSPRTMSASIPPAPTTTSLVSDWPGRHARYTSTSTATGAERLLPQRGLADTRLTAPNQRRSPFTNGVEEPLNGRELGIPPDDAHGGQPPPLDDEPHDGTPACCAPCGCPLAPRSLLLSGARAG